MKKLGFTPLALTALLVIGVITSFPLVVASNNVASWSIDDGSGNTVTDSVGGNTGTLYGGSWTSSAIVFNSSGYAWDLGKGSMQTPWALDFNGKDNYLEVPDTPALRSSNFSVAFWVSPDTSSDFGNVMGKQYYVEGQQEGWMIYWDLGTPRPMRLTAFTSSHTEINSVGVTVPLGEWTHLAFTLGNKTIAAYKNGQLVGERTNVAYLDYLSTNQPFRIGRAWGDSNYFDGLIDNVQFYNTSLTQTDLQNLYQNYTTTTERSTIIQLNQISISQGQESNITAKLVDDTMGRALTNVNVTFSINNNDLATVRTDSRGIAQIQYKPQETGTFTLTATYNGTGVYYGCVQTAQLVVESPLQQQVLLGVAGGAIALGAVVVVRRKRRSNGVEWGYDMEKVVGRFSRNDLVRTLELSAESLDRTKKAFERAIGGDS